MRAQADTGRTRQLKGQPIGGQFAEEVKSGSGLALAEAEPHDPAREATRTCTQAGWPTAGQMLERLHEDGRIDTANLSAVDADQVAWIGDNVLGDSIDHAEDILERTYIANYHPPAGGYVSDDLLFLDEGRLRENCQRAGAGLLVAEMVASVESRDNLSKGYLNHLDDDTLTQLDAEVLQPALDQMVAEINNPNSPVWDDDAGDWPDRALLMPARYDHGKPSAA